MTKLLEKVTGVALNRAARVFEEIEATEKRVDVLYVDSFTRYHDRLGHKRAGTLSGIPKYDDKVARDVFVEELAVLTLKWRTVIGDKAVRSMNAATLALNVAQWLGTSAQKREALDLMSQIRPYVNTYYPKAIETLVNREGPGVGNHAVLIEEKIIKWQKERWFGEGRYNLREDVSQDILREMLSE